MPVYLCKPGWASSEPWRHGIQVYAFPFHIPAEHQPQQPLTHQRRQRRQQQPGGGGGRGGVNNDDNFRYHRYERGGRRGGGGVIVENAAAAHAGTNEEDEDQTVRMENRNRTTNHCTALATATTSVAGGSDGPSAVAAAAAAAASTAIVGGGGVGGPEGLRRRRRGDSATERREENLATFDNNNSHNDTRNENKNHGGGQYYQYRTEQDDDVAANEYYYHEEEGVAVRRVRHSEVVLVDEVSISYGRYWLRLRWPGRYGGFAGYIALGLVTSKEEKEFSEHGEPEDDMVTGSGCSRISGKGDSRSTEGGDGKSIVSPTASSSVSAGGTARRTGAAGRRQFTAQLSEVSDYPPTQPPSPPGERTVEEVENIDDRSIGFFAATAEAANTIATVQRRDAVDKNEAEEEDEVVLDEEEDGKPAASDDSSRGSISPGLNSGRPVVAGRMRIETVLRSSHRGEIPVPPKCESTGLYFPSSAAMELLATYDDGLSSATMGEDEDGGHLPPHHGILLRTHIDAGEPVFCRICREGLHDVNYDMDAAGGKSVPKHQVGVSVAPAPPPPPSRPPPAATGGENAAAIAERRIRQRSDGSDDEFRSEEEDADSPVNGRQMIQQNKQRHAAAVVSSINIHHPTAENPLLAPCECSGSMAFVHYLCVEQWRCRSRHPAARNGLNCETCGAPYTLPPPPSRPVESHGGGGNMAGAAAGAGGAFAEEDWLEAMPAHVLAALRRPHPWWQMGAAIVRRRWLRPIAPVIMSPIVALYCRARRMLKKRGVSRRRWACSLCRRRARWKCVRCLRSYYCSRQCQNVSWHIVHKHVCYKPARFWWSVVVYGLGTLLAFPGILKDPLIYDLGLSLIPGSFIVMGIIGGGVASSFKKGLGMDLRGRSLELIVVIFTLWLSFLSWGLVWAFFGEPNQCWGTFGKLEVYNMAAGKTGWGFVKQTTLLLDVMRRVLFRPAMWWFVTWDKLFMHSGPFITHYICTKSDEDVTSGCFQNLWKANPDFYLAEHGGGKCAADLVTVSSFWVLAGAVLLAGTVFKRRNRDRRAVGRVGGVGVAIAQGQRDVGAERPHQD